MRARTSRQLVLCAALATLQLSAQVTAILHRHRSHGSHGLVEEAEDGEAIEEELEGGVATGAGELWECSSARGGSIDEDAEEYLIDNSLLQAKTKGMGYRFGKDLKNVDRKSFALWGTTVRGRRENEDWIKVGECFLPTHLKGVRVLTPTRIASRQAAPLKDPARGTVPERLPEAALSPGEASAASSAPPVDLLAPVAGAVAQAPPPPVVAASTTMLAEQLAPAVPAVTTAPPLQDLVLPAETFAATTPAVADLLRPVPGGVAQAPDQEVQLPVAAAAPALPAELPAALPAELPPALPAELPPAAAAVERRCSGQGSGGRYLLDNSQLQAQTKGMGLRFSKNTKDIDKSAKAVWGSTIIGTDLGDGWLQVGECYLPMDLKGIPVLAPLDAPAQSSTAEAVPAAVAEPSQAARAPETAVAAAAPQSAPVEASPKAAVGADAFAEPLQAPQTLPPAPSLGALGEAPQAVAVVAGAPLQTAASQASYSVTTMAPAQAWQRTSAETLQSVPAEEGSVAFEPPSSPPTSAPVAAPQSVSTEALQRALAPESLTAAAPQEVAAAEVVAPSVVAEAPSTPAVAPAVAPPLPVEQGPTIAPGGEQLAAPAQAPQQPLAAVAARGKCSLEGAVGQQSAYKLDNSVLQATTKGMGLRLSKNLKDIDKTTKAVWGSTVLGVDLRDGWLQVGNCYLPITLQGVPVLTPIPSGASSAEDAARPAAGAAQASSTQAAVQSEAAAEATTTQAPQATLQLPVEQETSPQPSPREAAAAPAAASEAASTTLVVRATVEGAPEPQAPPMVAFQQPDATEDAAPSPAADFWAKAASTTEAPKAALEQPAEQAAFQPPASGGDDVAAPSRAGAQASSMEVARAAQPLVQEAPKAAFQAPLSREEEEEAPPASERVQAGTAEAPVAALEQPAVQQAPTADPQQLPAHEAAREAPTADLQQLPANEAAAQALKVQASSAEVPRAVLEQSVQQKALQMATATTGSLLSSAAPLESQAWAAPSLPATMQPAVDQPEAARLTLEAAPERRAPPVLASEPDDEPPVSESSRPVVASTDDFQRGEREVELEVRVLKEKAAAAEQKAVVAEQGASRQLAQLEEELLEAKENVTSAEQTAAKSIAALKDELSRSKSSAALQEWTAKQRIAGLQTELSQANEAAKAAGEAKASADAKGYALEAELEELRAQEQRQAQELQRVRADADEQLRKLRTEAESADGAASARVADFEERLLKQRQAMEALTDKSAKVLHEREVRISNLTRQLEDAKAFAARDIAHYEQLSAEVNATAARRETELLQQLSRAREEAHDSSAERKAAAIEARAEELQRQLDSTRNSAAESLERLTREAANANANAQQHLQELEAQLAKEQEAARSAAAESARMLAANEAAGAALQRRLADLRRKAVEVGSAVAKHVSNLEEELQQGFGPAEVSSAAVMATRQVDAAVDSTEAAAQSEGSREGRSEPTRGDEDPGTGAFGELRRLRARSARSQDLARELSSLGGRALEAARALAARSADLAQELPARHSGRAPKDSRARELASQLGDLSSAAVTANEALLRAASDMEEELSRQHFALQSANEAVRRQLEAFPGLSSAAAIVGVADGADKTAELANASSNALDELEQLPERLEGLTRLAKLRGGALSAKIQALRLELEEEREAKSKVAADAEAGSAKAAGDTAALEAELEASRRNASEAFQRSAESERRAAQLGEQLQEMRQEARYDAERLQSEAARTSEADKRISALTEQLGKQRLDKLQADADLQTSQARSAELERQLSDLRSEAAAAGDKAAKRIAELEEKLGDQLS